VFAKIQEILILKVAICDQLLSVHRNGNSCNISLLLVLLQKLILPSTLVFVIHILS